MNLSPDYIPPAAGVPAAVFLWLVWAVIVWREKHGGGR